MGVKVLKSYTSDVNVEVSMFLPREDGPNAGKVGVRVRDLDAAENVGLHFYPTMAVAQECYDRYVTHAEALNG